MSAKGKQLLNDEMVAHGEKYGVLSHRDLPADNDKKRFYDVYEPDDPQIAKGNPVILYIYPDLFERAVRKPRQGFCTRLAARGFKVICAGYGDKRKKPFYAKDGNIKAQELIEMLNKKGELNDGRVIIFSDGSGSLIAMEYVMHIVREEVHSPIKPVAVVSFDGLYDLRRFAIAEGSKYHITKVLRAFTGAGLRNGIIPEEVVPIIRAINVCAGVDYRFPPLFFAHSACDRAYKGQGDLLAKPLRLKGISYREYKAVYLVCRHGWQFGNDTAAKSLSVSLGEFFSAVLTDAEVGNEYIEI